MMKRSSILDLYLKERKYQDLIHGNYINNPTLSLPSFLIFLKTYIDKALDTYTKDWSSDLPTWLVDCNEKTLQGSAPIMTYDSLIKIMALAGAALETYSEIDINEWRKDFLNPNQKGEL